MRKKNQLILVAIAVLLLFAASGQLQSVFFSTLNIQEPVFCSEWISIGCGIREEANKAAYLNTSDTVPDAVFTCNYDQGCEIESISTVDLTNCNQFAVRINGVAIPELSGVQGAVCAQYPLCTCETYQCVAPNFSKVSQNLQGRFLAKGSQLSITCTSAWLIATGYSHLNFYYTGKRLRLAYCSSGPTATSCDAGVSGVEIPTDGCHYNVGDVAGATNPAILNQQGQQIATQSYIVSQGSNIWIPNPAKQYVCGTKTDQCSADSDCYYQHAFSWPLGSGLGNAEIVGTSVNVYGCTATGPEKCTKWSGTVEGTGTCLQPERVNWCAIKQSNVYTCECNPLTSTCGANAFCDPADCRCKSTGTVACNSERDPVCGTQVFCDRVTKTMREPYCSNPGTTSSACNFRTLSNVQCCVAADCGTGYYCDADHQCQAQQQACQECPWGCCEGACVIPGNPYFPNVPVGKHCCPDHTNYWTVSETECNPFQCQSDSDCLPSQKCEGGECVDNTVCEEREPIWPWIVGWKLVIKETPTYLVPFPWGGGLIEIGKTTTETCTEILNWGLIIIIIIAIVGSLVALYFMRKKKRKGKRRRRR